MWEPGTKCGGLFRAECELLNCSITVTSSPKGRELITFSEGGRRHVFYCIVSAGVMVWDIQYMQQQMTRVKQFKPIAMFSCWWRKDKKVGNTDLTPTCPYKTENDSWHFTATALFSTSSLRVSLSRSFCLMFFLPVPVSLIFPSWQKSNVSL